MTFNEDMIQVIRYLYRFGYFSQVPAAIDPATGKQDWRRIITAGQDAITAALDVFHQYHGLPPKARQPGTALVADDEVMALVNAVRCGIPEFAQVEEARWQAPARLTYYDDIVMPGFTTQRTQELLDLAWDQWEAVCGITATRVLDRNQANVVSTARAIDGQGGTLAFAFFPTTGAPNEQRDQVYDPADAAYFQGEGEKNLLNCMTHELGHSLGFPHGPSGQCNLSPFLCPQYWAPQSTYDIPTGRQNYGPPLATDPDVPPEPAPPINPQPVSFVGSGIF